MNVSYDKTGNLEAVIKEELTPDDYADKQTK